MNKYKHLERAAVHAHRAGVGWNEFWREHGDGSLPSRAAQPAEVPKAHAATAHTTHVRRRRRPGTHRRRRHAVGGRRRPQAGRRGNGRPEFFGCYRVYPYPKPPNPTNETGLGYGYKVYAMKKEIRELERAALDELPPPRGAKAATIRSIGMKFSHLRRRVAGGRFIDSYETRLGVAWLVGRVERRGTSDTSGTNSYPFAGVSAGAHTRERTRG